VDINFKKQMKKIKILVGGYDGEYPSDELDN